jgi:hypothetical protein
VLNREKEKATGLSALLCTRRSVRGGFGFGALGLYRLPVVL